MNVNELLNVLVKDGIDWDTLEHTDTYGVTLNRGIFEWGFLYKETEVPEAELARHTHHSEPYWYTQTDLSQLLLLLLFFLFACYMAAFRARF